MKLLWAYFRQNYVIYGLAGLYLLALVLNNLGLDSWLPSCLVTHFTGYECLGCGLNRAAMALLSGDVKAALVYNPLIFLYLLPGLAWAGYDFYKFNLNYNLQTNEKH